MRWDLYADLYQKFDINEIKLIKKRIKKTKQVIQKYPDTYLKKKKDPTEHEKVTLAIWKLEILMKNISEEHNIYGRKEEEEEGL